MRRHRSEDVFGVQICAAYPDTAARAAEMIDKESEVDFIDLNVGCPIDLVVNKGAGSCLLTKPSRLQQIVKAASASIECQLTVKVSILFLSNVANYYMRICFEGTLIMSLKILYQYSLY